MRRTATKLLMASAALLLASCTPEIESRLSGLPSRHDQDGGGGGGGGGPDGGPLADGGADTDGGSSDGGGPLDDGGSPLTDGGSPLTDGGGPLTDGGSGAGGPTDAGSVDYCERFTCTCTSNDECTGAHEICVTDEGRRCDCAPGFVRAVGGECVLTVPADAEILDPEAWRVSGGAEVLPDAPGASGAVGVLRLATPTICVDGSARTTVTLPSYEVAGPLVVEVRYRNTAVPASRARGLELGIGGRSIILPPTTGSGYATTRVCLGERGYGSTYDVIVRPPLVARPGCADAEEEILVDRVIFLPAEEGECVAPGTIVDPSFADIDGGTYGWQYGATGEGASASRVTSGGDMGSAAGRMTLTRACSEAWISGELSWPTETTYPAPALRLWTSVLAGTGVEVTATRGAPAPPILGGLNSASSERIVCVPPWLQGTSVPARFAVRANGTCGGATSREATLDTLRFVNEPGCGSDPYVVGGDFQYAQNGSIASPWQIARAGASNSEVAEVAADPQGLDGMARALHLGNGGSCGVVTASTHVLVPDLGGPTGAPALRFFYRSRSDGAGAQTATVSVAGITQNLEKARGTMAPTTVCLPRSYAGRTAPLTFRIEGGRTCGTLVGTEFWIDDVMMRFDPSCPEG